MRPEGWQSIDAARDHWELRLQARPELVPILRARLRAWLEDVGARKSEVFEALLATTEAFTNAVEHTHEPTSHLVDVEGSLTGDCFTISIHDYGTWQSEQARKEQGGLGLVLMEALMDTVQVNCDVDGTTVTMQRRLAMH
jgi:anti-sigma regulatory factor (Ser/Thr protein kinase)